MFRKIVLMSIVALVPAVALAQKQRAVQHGGTTRYYDQSGRPEGRSVQHGNQTRFYDQKGRPHGWATQNGHTMRFYDQHGKPQGRSVRSR